MSDNPRGLFAENSGHNLTFSHSGTILCGSLVIPVAMGEGTFALRNYPLMKGVINGANLSFSLVNGSDIGLGGTINGLIYYNNQRVELSTGSGSGKRLLGTLEICNTTMALSGHYLGPSTVKGMAAAKSETLYFHARTLSSYVDLTIFLTDPATSSPALITRMASYNAQTGVFSAPGYDFLDVPEIQGKLGKGAADITVIWNESRKVSSRTGFFGSKTTPIPKIRKLTPPVIPSGKTGKVVVKHKGAVPGSMVVLTPLGGGGTARVVRYDYFVGTFDVYIDAPKTAKGTYRITIIQPNGVMVDSKKILTVN